jgi:hypothetical protein
MIVVAALSAVALSTAPAQSTDFWSGGARCEALLPSYWQSPDQLFCPIDDKTWVLLLHP